MCQGGCGPSGCNCTAVVVDSVQGPAGLSAYGQWLAAGNSGTAQDFLDSLIGAQGPTGATGADGATGPAGANGADGADGQNAYAVLSAPFNQPAVGANVFIAGAAGAFNWMVPGQYIFIEVGGFYEVVSIFNGGANANVTNVGYAADAFGFAGNAAPGAAVASGGGVSPAGVRGPAGATGATGPVGPTGATGAAGAAGTNGTQMSSGPELPNTLAPNVGAIGDYRIRVSAGSPGVALDIWTKINNTPTWSLVAVFPNAAGGGDQTFTAVKTSAQPLPLTNTNTVVTVENDSVLPGRDPSGTWNGSVWTLTADADAVQLAVRDMTIARSSGTQTVTFTAHIYHRPLSTGIDVSIGSTTFAFTGAAETSITSAIFNSSTVNFLTGDQVRLVVDPSVAPTDSFTVAILPNPLRFYAQSV